MLVKNDSKVVAMFDVQIDPEYAFAMVTNLPSLRTAKV